MKEEYQVLIVGSGPAAAACAKALKKEGVDAFIIEKDKLPRTKCCSAVLFGQTQVLLERYFGCLPPSDLYCNPKVLNGDNILEWNKEKGFANYKWEIPMGTQVFSKDYLNTWRDKFDFWLLKESGVPYVDECRFRNYSIDNGKIRVEVSRKNKDVDYLYCSYLVGADGGSSRLRTLLDPSFRTLEPAVGVYQAYYRFSNQGTLKDGRWYVFFESEIGDALSCVHRKDDLLALCVTGFKGRDLKTSMEKFKTLLSSRFQVVFDGMDRDEGCVMKLGQPFLGSGNIILAGEAAGLLYLNGEGISAAIDSGYKAGQSVAFAIREGKDVQQIYGRALAEILNHFKVCVDNVHFFVPRS